MPCTVHVKFVKAHCCNVLCLILLFSNAEFGQGSGVTWIYYVRCNGSESSLAQCSFSGWDANFCGHYQDVSVTCQPCKNAKTNTRTARCCMQDYHLQEFLSTFTATFSAPFYPIRLVSGDNSSNTTNGQLNYGRVEIFINNTWGTICDQGWGIEDAEIACRQLGKQLSMLKCKCYKVTLCTYSHT